MAKVVGRDVKVMVNGIRVGSVLSVRDLEKPIDLDTVVDLPPCKGTFSRAVSEITYTPCYHEWEARPITMEGYVLADAQCLKCGTWYVGVL